MSNHRYQSLELRIEFMIAAAKEAQKEAYTKEIADYIVSFANAVTIEHMISAEGIDASVKLFYEAHGYNDKDPNVETAAIALKEVISNLEHTT